MKRYDMNVIMDERYDDLKEIRSARNADGDRWDTVEDMVEHLDRDLLLEELDVTQDEIDAVVLGEAMNLETARVLIEEGEGI